jgi:hypothetical protein
MKRTSKWAPERVIFQGVKNIVSRKGVRIVFGWEGDRKIIKTDEVNRGCDYKMKQECQG